MLVKSLKIGGPGIRGLDFHSPLTWGIWRVRWEGSEGDRCRPFRGWRWWRCRLSRKRRAGTAGGTPQTGQRSCDIVIPVNNIPISNGGNFNRTRSPYEDSFACPHTEYTLKTKFNWFVYRRAIFWQNAQLVTSQDCIKPLINSDGQERDLSFSYVAINKNLVPKWKVCLKNLVSNGFDFSLY